MPTEPVVTPPPPERLALTIQETATCLGLSTKTVDRLLRSGKLRRVAGIRHRRITVLSLHKFLAG